MKANAPEKIYISPKVFNIGVYVTKVLTTKYEDNIEYIRTDAFIEKAERYIRSIADGLDRDDDVEAFISEFRKHMKGE